MQPGGRVRMGVGDWSDTMEVGAYGEGISPAPKARFTCRTLPIEVLPRFTIASAQAWLARRRVVLVGVIAEIGRTLGRVAVRQLDQPILTKQARRLLEEGADLNLFLSIAARDANGERQHIGGAQQTRLQARAGVRGADVAPGRVLVPFRVAVDRRPVDPSGERSILTSRRRRSRLACCVYSTPCRSTARASAAITRPTRARQVASRERLPSLDGINTPVSSPFKHQQQNQRIQTGRGRPPMVARSCRAFRPHMRPAWL